MKVSDEDIKQLAYGIKTNHINNDTRYNFCKFCNVNLSDNERHKSYCVVTTANKILDR